jgi:hypothetical protein
MLQTLPSEALDYDFNPSSRPLLSSSGTGMTIRPQAFYFCPGQSIPKTTLGHKIDRSIHLALETSVIIYLYQPPFP